MLEPVEHLAAMTNCGSSIGSFGFGGTSSTIDRKRARPQDNFNSVPPYARKKVASEISFEFQSLSLTTVNGVHLGPTLSSPDESIDHTFGLIHQQFHDCSTTPMATAHTVSVVGSGTHVMQPIRGSHHHHYEHDHDTSISSTQSPPAFSPSTCSSPSSPVPCSTYSSLSLQLSQPTFSLPSVMATQDHHHEDMELGKTLDSHLSTIFKSDHSADSPLHNDQQDHSTEPMTDPPVVLNMRQRKWNSSRKEWQEWHEVQATHAPDLPSSPQQLHDSPHQHTTLDGTMENMELLIEPIGSSASLGDDGDPTSTTQQYAHTSKELSHCSDPHGTGYTHNESSRGKQTTRNLFRQRSLNEPRDTLSENEKASRHIEQEERHSVSTRSRSFSETHIYPYTHHNLQQYQSLFHLQQFLPNQTQPHDHVVTDTQQNGHHPANSLARGHTESYPIHGVHQLITQSGSLVVGRSNSHASPAAPDLLHRLRHSHSGSNVSDHRSRNDYPQAWASSLTMTPLGGVSGPGPSSSRRPVSASSSPALSPSLGYRLEEPRSWAHQLLQSQANGGQLGQPCHQNYSQYQGGDHYSHPSFEQDDIAMGEDWGFRSLPSRSTSPSPCLSMVPAVNRPLSISFSQMVGSHMLEDLAEHDDDMEQ